MVSFCARRLRLGVGTYHSNGLSSSHGDSGGLALATLVTSTSAVASSGSNGGSLDNSQGLGGGAVKSGGLFTLLAVALFVGSSEAGSLSL